MTIIKCKMEYDAKKTFNTAGMNINLFLMQIIWYMSLWSRKSRHQTFSHIHDERSERMFATSVCDSQELEITHWSFSGRMAN